MCFYRDNENDKPVKIKKDRKCYKILRTGYVTRINGEDVKKTDFIAPYQSFVYRLRKMNRMPKGFEIEKSYSVNDGFHSLSSLKSAREFNEENFYNDSRFCIVECVIPAGSMVLRSKERGQFVSDAIKAVRRVK